MMHLCASAAELRSGGPKLQFGLEARSDNGSPPPRIVLGADDIPVVGHQVNFVLSAHATGRRATPIGILPVVTKRQSSISSLRAKATIMVLRVLGASLVRARYHRAKSLSFWNI